MKEKVKVLVFGYFGYHTHQLDGQTIKTRSIYEMLRTHDELEVRYADTQEFRYSIKAIWIFIVTLLRCDRLIYIPAHNNLKYLFPMIFVTANLFRFQIICVAVGGWLPEYLRNLLMHRKFLGKIKGILMENSYAVSQLRELYGFQHVSIIPNFRHESVKDFLPRIREKDEILRLVFMARINRMKGLDTIAGVAAKIKEEYPGIIISIDFYGPVLDADKTYFEQELIEKYTFIHYKGILEPNKIVSTLRAYDAMLFPTHYFTEGFPGSILDAYRAGIPVIATRWKYAAEFVQENVTGYIVDFKNPISQIFSCITRLYLDSSLLLRLKEGAYKRSLYYTPEAAWGILKPLILN